MSADTKQAWSDAAPAGTSSMTNQERYDAAMAAEYRQAADGGETDEPSGSGYEPAADKPRLPSLDLAIPTQPDFSSGSWLDPPAGNLADHPLLRGLLLELPPKGSTPPPGWLDRWFDATRSILELLYVRDGSIR